jgi:hypothetical protein
MHHLLERPLLKRNVSLLAMCFRTSSEHLPDPDARVRIEAVAIKKVITFCGMRAIRIYRNQ